MLKNLLSFEERLSALTNDELSDAIDKTLVLYHATRPIDPQHHYLRHHLYDLLTVQRMRAQNLAGMPATDVQALIDKTAGLVGNIPPTDAICHYLRHHLYELLNVQKQMAQEAA